MRAIGILEKDFRLDKDDFSNERYNCVGLLKSPSNTTAALMQSRFGIPERWCVIYGSVNLFFTSKKSALDYCAKHGFTNYD